MPHHKVRIIKTLGEFQSLTPVDKLHDLPCVLLHLPCQPRSFVLTHFLNFYYQLKCVGAWACFPNINSCHNMEHAPQEALMPLPLPPGGTETLIQKDLGVIWTNITLHCTTDVLTHQLIEFQQIDIGSGRSHGAVTKGSALGDQTNSNHSSTVSQDPPEPQFHHH